MARILLIEDDEQFREMLTQMLSGRSHRVTVASDGDEGLRLAREIQPELIITDILLPHKDGIETIQALNQAGSKVPIIAISGGRRMLSAQFNLDSAAMMGVEATLAKPFSRDELYRAVDRVFAAKQESR